MHKLLSNNIWQLCKVFVHDYITDNEMCGKAMLQMGKKDL
jgi:hypothetical protein